MNPYEAALAILDEVETLDADTIKAATMAALLVSDTAGDLPVAATEISIEVSTRAKKRLGRCRFIRRRDDFGDFEYAPAIIEISLPGAALVERTELADTIAHEVAHASLPFDIKHCAVWQDRARSYGASPTACSAAPEVSRSYRYAYYCPSCADVIGRQAGKPRRSRICSACSSPVATVDLRSRKILPGHGVSVETERDADHFRETLRATIDDYRDALASIRSLTATVKDAS